MILDTLENAWKYQSFSPDLHDALEELKQIILTDLPVGRHELSNGRYVMVQHYETKPIENGVWEAHREYIDIQYVADGQEWIGYAPASRLSPIGDYDKTRDFQGYSGTGDVLFADKGYFFVFWPEDVHMPGLGQDSTPIKKLVLKVPI